MKNKKQVLAGILAATFTIGAFAGCGKKDENAGTGEVPTLLWYLPGSGIDDAKKVSEELSKISEEKIGAKLDLQFIDAGAYTERMNMNMASGSKFDLCFTGYINPYDKAATKGGILALDELLEKTPALKESIPEYAWEGARMNDGSIYAVPNLQVMASQKAITMEKELVEKYNFDVSKVTKLEDIETFLEKVKQNEPDYYPFDPSWGVSAFDCIPENSTMATNYIMATKQSDGSFKFKSAIEVPKYVSAIEKIREWYEKGYIRKDIATVMDSSDSSKKSASGVAVYKPGMEAESYAKSKGKTNIIAIPYGEASISENCGRTAMTGIGKGSQNPEKAIKMLELVNTDKEFFNMLCFGIEDVHYKKTGENKIEFLDVENNGYYINSAWEFGNQFNAYLIPGQEDDVWEKTIEFNSSAKKGLLAGFTLESEHLKNEMAQIENVFTTYKRMDNGSEATETYLKEFVEKAKKAGIDTVCEDFEKQIKEQLKK